jgi:hypothetical protein
MAQVITHLPSNHEFNLQDHQKNLQ